MTGYIPHTKHIKENGLKQHFISNSFQSKDKSWFTPLHSSLISLQRFRSPFMAFRPRICLSQRMHQSKCSTVSLVSSRANWQIIGIRQMHKQVCRSQGFQMRTSAAGRMCKNRNAPLELPLWLSWIEKCQLQVFELKGSEVSWLNLSAFRASCFAARHTETSLWLLD